MPPFTKRSGGGNGKLRETSKLKFDFMVDPVSMQNVVIRSPGQHVFQKVENETFPLSSCNFNKYRSKAQKVEREIIPSPETDSYTGKRGERKRRRRSRYSRC